jgi:TatD DNase family protein
MSDALLPGRRGLSLHDTHCHVDLFPDPQAIVREAEVAQVYTIAVTTTPSVFEHLERLLAGSRFVRPAIGLHPELVAARSSELPLFHAALSRTRYVGEVGLDYVTADDAERKLQRRVLSEILTACAEYGDKIITSHSRRAADDVIDAFGAGFRGTWILHWYSGSERALRRALDHGAYFSVNPAMLSSERGRRLISTVPPDRVLLESDGPFVTCGGPMGSSPVRPLDAIETAAELSRLWSIALEDTAVRLKTTFRALLSSGGSTVPSGDRV